MFKGLIISNLNAVVIRTVEKYQLKYGADIELFLSKQDEKLIIQVLANYSQKEIIGVKDLNIPMISPETAEAKILTALEVLEIEYNIVVAKLMLLVKNEQVIAYLYDKEKPLKQIDISKII
jgi:hypothetical protein